MKRRRHVGGWSAPGLMVASGFASLGYQVVWTEQSAAWLGHESAAVLAVVAAFLGGLGVGAWALGTRIEASARPARWYAGCELGVALWGVVVLLVGPTFGGWMLGLAGAQPTPLGQWSMAFAGTFLALLPATAAMGATLPAMARLTATRDREGPSLALLYASNTLGAVLGVLATSFGLIPAFGLVRSAALCVALNVLCASAALSLFPKAAEPSPAAIASGAPRSGGLVLQGRLAATGFLGIGYEVLVVRVLSQVTEDTVYTFALLLAVYLVGTATGAAGYHRWRKHRGDRPRLGDWLLAALSIACLLGTASLWEAEHVKRSIAQALGGGMASALAAEASLALLAFGLPTLVMGALFSHLARCASTLGIGFGRALAINTLAGAAAPALFGVLAVPAFGLKASLLAIPLGYLASTTPRAWSTWAVGGPAAATLVLALLAPPLGFVEVPAGGHVVRYDEGVMAAVSVVEDAEGVARLRIDDRQQEGSSSTLRVDARQAWLPLLLHPAPRRALFLGLGTGVTASSAAADPTLEVDAVELLPEVIAASAYFAPVTRAFAGGAVTSRLHVVSADARRFVRATSRDYDVIVSDNFHPARSGAGALYTVEHFQAVQRRLALGGLFCQWLPLHQLDLPTLRSIVKSFLTVNPGGWAMLANNGLETPVLGLVARAGGGRFDLTALRDRLSTLTLPQQVASLGLEDELSVLGGMVAGPEALQRFSANADPNTDDHPVVRYRAPRITYAPDSSPADRLDALLSELSITPDTLLLPVADAAWARRLAAYWAARDRFLALGRGVRPSPRVVEMLAQVREPLLAVLRISPDFRPAYDPLLAMAAALTPSDAAAAHALLAQLRVLQPARSEAGRLLARLDAEAAGPSGN